MYIVQAPLDVAGMQWPTIFNRKVGGEITVRLSGDVEEKNQFFQNFKKRLFSTEKLLVVPYLCC